jgi:uncharacterized protein YbbK (DUF523 family)
MKRVDLKAVQLNCTSYDSLAGNSEHTVLFNVSPSCGQGMIQSGTNLVI